MSPGLWLEAARPKTLPAAAAPVLVGMAVAVHDGVFHVAAALLALLSALCIQIATNFHNDVADFEKGADREDRLGPRRLVAAGLITPAAMHRATYLTFGAAVVAGTWLMIRGGWPIVMIGAASIACGLAYTGGKRSLAYLGIADLFVFVFFGPIAVAGTYFVQALSWSTAAWIAGLGPGALSVAILLVNNIRDVDQDVASGKRTLVVRIGRAGAMRLYAACCALALTIPVVLLAFDMAPWTILLALAAAPAMVFTLRDLALVPPAEAVRFNPLLGRTARNLLVYCALLGIGWML